MIIGSFPIIGIPLANAEHCSKEGLLQSFATIAGGVRSLYFFETEFIWHIQTSNK